MVHRRDSKNILHEFYELEWDTVIWATHLIRSIFSLNFVNPKSELILEGPIRVF